jgi:acetyl-CoA carboxylase biotin carboxyl carrier protein
MTSRADEIAGLAVALAESGLAELHLTGPGTDIHLMRSCTGEVGRMTPSAPAQVITASGVGIFLSRHPLHTAALAGVGRRVRTGQTVALLRVGHLLRPVTAPMGGHLSAPLAEEAAIVGYGAPLFQLHPEQPETQE